MFTELLHNVFRFFFNSTARWYPLYYLRTLHFTKIGFGLVGNKALYVGNKFYYPTFCMAKPGFKQYLSLNKPFIVFSTTRNSSIKISFLLLSITCYTIKSHFIIMYHFMMNNILLYCWWSSGCGLLFHLKTMIEILQVQLSLIKPYTLLENISFSTILYLILFISYHSCIL